MSHKERYVLSPTSFGSIPTASGSFFSDVLVELPRVVTAIAKAPAIGEVDILGIDGSMEFSVVGPYPTTSAVTGLPVTTLLGVCLGIAIVPFDTVTGTYPDYDPTDLDAGREDWIYWGARSVLAPVKGDPAYAVPGRFSLALRCRARLCSGQALKAYLGITPDPSSWNLTYQSFLRVRASFRD